MMRKQAAAAAANSSDILDLPEVVSDNEADDVDSDDAERFLAAEDEHGDFEGYKDYIEF